MIDPHDEFLKPLVTSWLGKISLAKKAKEPFNEVAEQCMAFYSGAMGFMWEDKYRRRFMGGQISPKFKLTMCKAFELVALFGPILYNRNPIRTVKPREAIQFGPEVFGVDPSIPPIQQGPPPGAPPPDPSQPPPPPPPPPTPEQMLNAQRQQMFDQAMHAEHMRLAAGDVRCQLMEKYLSYTPGEQPYGGLEQAAEDAITEALIKGRGILFLDKYTPPGSERTLTGAFYRSVDDLLLDPDAESIEDIQWMALKCVHPYRQVEKEYGLKRDALKGRANTESVDAMAGRAAGELGNIRRAQGQASDLLTYWKIWSKAGVGTRTLEAQQDLDQAFDQVVGDHAYIVVAEGVPYPLNAPKESVSQASEEEVKGFFDWPVPFWTDNKWPIAMLDFYRKPRSVWPIAPLAPGLGELTFLNVVMSHLCNRLWSSTRDFVAIDKSAAAEVEAAIKKGEDLAILKINPTTDISKALQWIQQPQANQDIWRILSEVMEQFDKRVGLTELVYGITSTQSRTAADIQAKNEKTSIRPDHMSKRVEKWLTEASVMEKFMAYWFVKGEGLVGLLGGPGAMLWDQLIANEDPEIILREMDCTIESGSARKPNKDRDMANIGQFIQAFGPIIQEYTGATGDFAPAQALLDQWGKAMDANLGIQFKQPPPPQPSPEIMAKVDLLHQQAEIDKQQAQLELMIAQQKAQMEMSMQQAELSSKMQLNQLETSSKLGELRLKAAAASQELKQDQQQHSQEMRQSSQQFSQQIKQDRLKGQQELKLKAKQAATNGAAKK